MSNTHLDTDDFLVAVRTILIGSELLPELEDANVVQWHHGETDPDEDIKTAIAKCGGVSVLIYDEGGDEDSPDADLIEAVAYVELYVDTTKRNRRKNTSLRLGGQIRDEIMRLLHRHADLRNTAAFADTRCRGYRTLADPEFAAWRITLTRKIYLSLE
jgi:hypothetical protein